MGFLKNVLCIRYELHEVVSDGDKIESERAVGTTHMAHHIATRFGLRPGLTEAEAADILWALTAPELADRFIRRRGWTLDRYKQWLAQAMADALVGP